MIVSELASGDADALEQPRLLDSPIPTRELSWEYPKRIESLLAQRPRMAERPPRRHGRSDRSWESWRWPLERNSEG